MNLRLLAAPLTVATLLLSTLGCSKKEDPAATTTPTTPTTPTTTNTGSFKRDGVTVTGTVSWRVETYKINYQDARSLYITITEPTQPQSNARSATLEYVNYVSGTTGNYQLQAITYKGGSSNLSAITTYPASNSTATLKDGSTPGSYSGTFSGTGTIHSSGASSTLTDGVFTDAQR